jgi:hypothetical protein
MATHARLFDEQFESVEDSVNQPIGRRRAGILGDVGPDLLEVLFRKDGQPIRHLRLLGASGTTARLDPIGELPPCGLVKTSVASGQLIKTRLHVGTKLLTRLVAFFQEPECLTDNFAGSLVQTALDFLVHESLEFGRQRDVHYDLASGSSLSVVANIVNV